MILKTFSDNDIYTFSNWLAKEHVRKWYEYPEEWIKEVKERRNIFSFISHFIAYENEKPIGFCQYYPYIESGENWQGDIKKEGTYSIDYLVGEEDYLGKGYGKLIIKELIKKVFSLVSAERIIVQPDDKNKKSCAVLLANGFIFDEKNKLYLLSKN